MQVDVLVNNWIFEGIIDYYLFFIELDIIDEF